MNINTNINNRFRFEYTHKSKYKYRCKHKYRYKYNNININIHKSIMASICDLDWYVFATGLNTEPTNGCTNFRPAFWSSLGRSCDMVPQMASSDFGE